MIIPNFASRPFLNSRPVILVALAAAVLAVLLVFLNIKLYLESNQSLATQLELRDELGGRYEALEAEVQSNLAGLTRIPWKSLGYRVRGLNVVLNAHAFSWLDLLDDLGRTMPYGVRVVSISPEVTDEGVLLDLEAVARSREDLLDFLDRLIADPKFSNPFPTGEKWPEAAQTVGYSFGLTVSYAAAQEEAP